MLVIMDEKYLEEVKAFADKIGLREQLDEKLKYLDEYAEHGDRGKTVCRLGKDFAPYSFAFTMLKRTSTEGKEYEYFFNGGLLFHDPHDGGGSGSFPTLAVTLEPIHGWSVHT